MTGETEKEKDITTENMEENEASPDSGDDAKDAAGHGEADSSKEEDDASCPEDECAGEDNAGCDAAKASESADGASKDEGSDESCAKASDNKKTDRKKKGFFGGKGGREETKELEEKIGELKDSLQRQMAEFDNFRKRTEKEKAARYEVGARSVIEKILPVVDSLERGFSMVEDDDREDAFVKGVDQVYRQMLSIFDEIGVKEIAAMGEKFNPDLHNAVMHIDDESAGEGEIVEVFQKGYTYKGTVVRYSMVKVAN